MRNEPDVEVRHTFDLGLLGATDLAIFSAARDAGAVVVTKDADFVELQHRLGVPPQLVWVTTGNVSNASLQRLIASAWSDTVALLRAGEPLVELGDRRAWRPSADDS
jgi:predicted nuclease of predicted toxin-antitoxin system